jgi:hypothetical protein
VQLTSGNPKAVIAALQLYSDKTLLNNTNLSAHPMGATLLNVKDTRRLRVTKCESRMPFIALERTKDGKLGMAVCQCNIHLPAMFSLDLPCGHTVCAGMLALACLWPASYRLRHH